MNEEINLFHTGQNGELKGLLGSILDLVQKKFNFTIVWKNFNGYGIIKDDLSWSGSIGDLMMNKIDVCMHLFLTFKSTILRPFLFCSKETKKKHENVHI